MPWVKLDAGFPDHPKVAAAGWRAAWLYVCGLTYCSRYLTDGRIPKSQVKRLSDVPKPEVEAERLIAAGLWVEDGDSYVVHDYTSWQMPSEKVDEIKERGKERAKRSYEERAKNQRRQAQSSREERVKNRDSSPEHSSPDVDVDKYSSSSVSDITTSDARWGEEEEDDDPLMLEAKRRRRARVGPPIADEHAWLRKTVQQLRDEGWQPERPRLVAQPRCLGCMDLPLADGCDDCGGQGHTTVLEARHG